MCTPWLVGIQHEITYRLECVVDRKCGQVVWSVGKVKSGEMSWGAYTRFRTG